MAPYWQILVVQGDSTGMSRHGSTCTEHGRVRSRHGLEVLYETCPTGYGGVGV